MHLETRQEPNATVLLPQGALTRWGGAEALRAALHDVVEAGARRVVLDGRGITSIDSSGLSALVAALVSVRNHGGHLKLSNMPPTVSKLLEITQLTSVFEVYAHQEDALADF